MEKTAAKIARRVVTAAACGLLALIPALEGCSDNDSAYGPGPCYRVSCNTNQDCIDEPGCGSNYFCSMAAPDGGTGQCQPR